MCWVVIENVVDNVELERNCLRERFHVYTGVHCEQFIAANSLEKESESCSPREQINCGTHML